MIAFGKEQVVGEDAPTVVEYGLLVALVALAVTAAWRATRSKLKPIRNVAWTGEKTQNNWRSRRAGRGWACITWPTWPVVRRDSPAEPHNGRLSGLLSRVFPSISSAVFIVCRRRCHFESLSRAERIQTCRCDAGSLVGQHARRLDAIEFTVRQCYARLFPLRSTGALHSRFRRTGLAAEVRRH
jgi:hypothetical protein